MHILLDSTLALLLPFWAEPAGIDRVSLAQARRWGALPPTAATLVARTPGGALAALPDRAGRDFLAAVAARLAPGHDPAALSPLRREAAALMARHALGAGRPALEDALRRHHGAAALVTASSHLLHAPRALRQARAGGARFVPVLHDMLPVSHPEYSPANGRARHVARMALAAHAAAGAVAVSEASRTAIEAHWEGHGLPRPPTIAAHPGLDLPGTAPAAVALPARPYFVVLSTLVPRKNHLLLLQLWKELAARPDAPLLAIIGRRGWENGTAFQLLDRADFRGTVLELGRLPDAEAAAWLRGARALLFPSLAEGFGIPLAEALALGVPAIASDIPAFREVGGREVGSAVPEFLHPLDGPGWRDAVLDYALPDSPRRAAQRARLAGWRAPSWDDHFGKVEAFLQSLPEGRP